MDGYVYGYGFDANRVTDKNLLQFVRKFADKLTPRQREGLDFDKLESLDSFQIWADDTVGEEKIYDMAKGLFDTCYHDNLREMLLETTGEIMKVISGIGFEYYPIEYDDDYIMLSSGMPWLFTPAEHRLTEKDLHDWCVFFTKELGIPNETIGEITNDDY